MFIPKIHKFHIDLLVFNRSCVVFKSEQKDIECDIYTPEDCRNCVFHINQKYTLLDWLMVKGYINKEEALQLRLEINI